MIDEPLFLFLNNFAESEIMDMTAIIPRKPPLRTGEIILKQYGERTVVSKYPDMSNIVPSGSQKQKRRRFAEAVAYAKTINNSTVLKADFIKRNGEVRSVYQGALKEFLNREW